MTQIPSHIADFVRAHADVPAFYLYDLAVMRSQMDLLSCLSQNVKTYYAMKVNPEQETIEQALSHPNISWIEIASKGELNKVLQANQKIFQKNNASNVIYTWPSKQFDELELSIEKNIHTLNVESFTEALRIDQIAAKFNKIQNVLIRLNSKFDFKDWHAQIVLGSGDTQFGFVQDNAIEELKKFDKLKNISVKWFHVYPASWVLKAADLLESVQSTFETVKRIEQETWKNFEIIDFGGGFGIDYDWKEKFDIKEYANWLEKLIQKYKMQDKSLYLELWRFLAADCWYFVTKVNDIKTLKSGKKAVLTCAWTGAHKRPQVLNVNYKMWVVNINEDAKRSELEERARKHDEILSKVSTSDNFDVFGPFCTSVDKILRDKTWYEIQIGDFIVMLESGAYWRTMSPQEFLSHPKVAEFFINQK